MTPRSSASSIILSGCRECAGERHQQIKYANAM
jgi:hypothetical protein